MGVPSGNSIPTTTFADPSPTNSRTLVPAGTETISPPRSDPRFISKGRSGSDSDDSHVSSSSASAVSSDEALDVSDEVEEKEDESSGKAEERWWR